MAVSIAPSSVSLYTNQSQEFIAYATDGTPPYMYYWGTGNSLASALNAAGRSVPTTRATFSPTFTMNGTFFVVVAVVDSGGNSASDYSIVTVSPSPIVPVVSKRNLYIIGGIAAIALAVGAIGGYYVLKRRR